MALFGGQNLEVSGRDEMAMDVDEARASGRSLSPQAAGRKQGAGGDSAEEIPPRVRGRLRKPTHGQMDATGLERGKSRDIE